MKRRITAGVLMGLLLLGSAGAEQPAGGAAPAWDRERANISIVTNGWVDVRDILRTIAANADLGLQMAPDVQGEVNVHLENVGISRALDAVLEPVNLGYEVIGDILVVHRRGLVTRWFTFDYPVTEREGRGELQVSAGRSESSSGGGSSGGSDENQNQSHVTSTAVMSVWPEVMHALQILVFQGVDNLRSQSGREADLGLSLADAEGRSLVVNPMASLVQVTAEWDRVRQVDELLSRLKESLQRQVAIEVRIMEVYLDEERKTGINWQTIGGGDIQAGLQTFNPVDNIDEKFFQFVVDSKNITAVLQAIETTGDVRTVSTPRVTTLNNQKAVVRVVTEDVYYEAQVEPAVISNGVATEPVVNYTPRVVPVGVVLDVTPQVGHDRVITLNVHPTISDVVGIAESPNADTAPILAVRELDTVGKVRAGQTLVIAGLISQRTRKIHSGVPILKDIPLLGYLFKSTDDRQVDIELVMLLTPIIMDGDEAAAEAEAARAEMEKKIPARM